MKIINRREAINLGNQQYFTGKSCKYGHISTRWTSSGNCSVCLKKYSIDVYKKDSEKIKNRAVEWKFNNLEKARLSSRKHFRKNKNKYNARSKVWAALNTEKIKKARKEWVLKNPERYKFLKDKWIASNKKILAFHAAKRRFLVFKSTPIWSDLETIKNIYEKCPNGFHVDHLIPVKGITSEGNRVSGLHVPLNLRYLPAVINISRGNRMTADEVTLVENFL